MVKGRLNKVLVLIPLSVALVLGGCTSKEEKELEIQKRIEEESNKKATEMARKYEEERNKSRVTPYTINEMDDNFGKSYKSLRERIDIFNNDLRDLKEGNITVYDINKKITDFRLEMKKYEDVDELKIPDDYLSFYRDFILGADRYISSLERLGDAYQVKDADAVSESVDNLAKDIEYINDVEFGIFGSPLADVLFSGKVKERSDKKLKGLCSITVNEKNEEYLESIKLPEVDKTKMEEDELMERIAEEEKYAELIKEYEKESKDAKKECYDNVMTERASFGNRVVESDNADLEQNLMDTLEKHRERMEEEQGESEGTEELETELESEEGEE